MIRPLRIDKMAGYAFGSNPPPTGYGLAGESFCIQLLFQDMSAIAAADRRDRRWGPDQSQSPAHNPVSGLRAHSRPLFGYLAAERVICF